MAAWVHPALLSALLLSVLLCVAPSDAEEVCGETSHQATYAGYIYRTLLRAELAGTVTGAAKFEEYEHSWEEGWEVSPDDSDDNPGIAANVIAVHNWQCERLVTATKAYATGIQEDPAPGSITDHGPTPLWESRVTDSQRYIFLTEQPEGNKVYRLLLRKQCVEPSTATVTSTVPPLLVLSPCGTSGRLGPTQVLCNADYGLPPMVQVVGGGYQKWSVPVTSMYSIEARGAQGGSQDTTPGGSGALAAGTFALTQGDELLVVVGHEGRSSEFGGSGGGGTFVAKINSFGADAFAVGSLSGVRVELLIVAGGGAGAQDSKAAGGRGIVDPTGASSGLPGAGGGFRLDGVDSDIDGYSRAMSFLNGATGGASAEQQGGFGGGGPPVSPTRGGGGGGYEGGSCDAEGCLGGTSFGTVAIADFNEGDGVVTITQITTTTTSTSSETATTVTITVSDTTSTSETTTTGSTTVSTTSTSSATTTTTSSNTATATSTSTASTITSTMTSLTATGTATLTTVSTSTTNTLTSATFTTSKTTFTTTTTMTTTSSRTSATSTMTVTHTSTSATATISTATTTFTITSLTATTSTSTSATSTTSTTASMTSVTATPTATATALAAGEMEAEEAVTDLQDAVGEIAKSLLDSAILSAEPTQPVSEQVGDSVVTFLVTTVDAAAANGGFVSISPAPLGGGKFTPSIKVPQAVLEQAVALSGTSGPVALAASSLPGTFTAAFQEAREGNGDLQVLGSPLSISVLSADGTPLSGVELAEPIEFTLLQAGPPDAQCTYWDDERDTWSSDGVERVAVGDGGPVVCATSHLTIFAAVLGQLIAIGEDIVDILKCSTATTVFSLEGVQALVRGGDWWGAAPTIMVWIWLAIFAALFALARRQDIKRPQAFPWELDQQELPTNSLGDQSESLEEEQGEESGDVISEPEGEPTDSRAPTRSHSIRQSLGEVGGRTGLQLACDCCAAILNLPNVFTIFIVELPEAPRKVVTNCVHRVHAYKSGIDEDSLHTVKEVVFATGQEQHSIFPTPSSPPRTSLRSAQSSSSLHSNFHRAASGLAEAREVHKKGRTAVDSFVGVSCPRRALVLFPAVHPWVHIFSYSMFVPHTARVAMLMMKIFGSVAVSALFLSAAGGMLTPDSPIECAPDDLRGQLVEAVFVGMVAAVFSDCIVALLFALRRETIAADFDRTALARQRGLWRLRMRIFWVVALCHLLLSVFVVMVFLANVSSGNIDEWGLTAVFTLVQDFLVMPLLVAFLLSSVASLVMWCRPSLRETAMQTPLQTRVQQAPPAKAGVGKGAKEPTPHSGESPGNHGFDGTEANAGNSEAQVELAFAPRSSGINRQGSRTSKDAKTEASSSPKHSLSRQNSRISRDTRGEEVPRRKIVDSL